MHGLTTERLDLIHGLHGLQESLSVFLVTQVAYAERDASASHRNDNICHNNSVV